MSDPSAPQLVGSLPEAEALARIEALEEAAGHLEMDWTEDPEERKQGTWVALVLRHAAREVFESIK